jgi:hypothetical protein
MNISLRLPTSKPLQGKERRRTRRLLISRNSPAQITFRRLSLQSTTPRFQIATKHSSIWTRPTGNTILCWFPLRLTPIWITCEVIRVSESLNGVWALKRAISACVDSIWCIPATGGCFEAQPRRFLRSSPNDGANLTLPIGEGLPTVPTNQSRIGWPSSSRRAIRQSGGMRLRTQNPPGGRSL